MLLHSAQSPEKQRLYGCEPEESCYAFASVEEGFVFIKKSGLKKILVHANKVIWHRENGGTVLEASF